MSDHVVSQLDLHLEGPDVSRADSGVAQRFTKGVLERAFDLMETRLNGRILAIRKLPFRISLSKSDLRDSKAMEDAASDLAAVLERHLHRIPADPAAAADPDSTLLLFQTREHEHAAALGLLARRITPWFAPQFRSVDQALQELCDDPFAMQVLALLEEQVLHDILQAAAPSTLQRIWDLLCQKSTRSAPLPAASTGPSSSGGEIVRADSKLRRLLQVLRKFPEASLSEQAAASAPSTESSTDTSILPPALKVSPKPKVITHQRHLHIPENRSHPKLLRQLPEASPVSPSSEPISSAPIPTAAAGLFYLLNPALELDAGEILWRAGVDERMIFTDAAKLLASEAPSTDPAFIQFGGTTTSSVDWQQSHHVANALISALAAAIARRKLARPPLCVCNLSLQGTRAILLALPPHIPCLAVLPGEAKSLPLDLWPFGTVSSLTCHVNSIPSADIVEEYLASADSADLPRRAIAATVAGSLCALAALRLMHFGEESPALVIARALRTAGQLHANDDELTVRIASDSLLLAIRRAGLDRDPGWIPWQKRAVRFEFFEAEPVASKTDS